MPREVCPECYAGMHVECIGQGCYCDCQFDLEDDFDETEPLFDCHMDRNGFCGKAGSEECDFECPYRDVKKN